MEKWSFGYAVLKVIAKFAFQLSHHKITVIGKENIPYGKPIIFAPNHQNALMDPLAILFTIKSQPVWLARADIFNSPLIRSILKFLKILPIYRIRDGKENLGKNDSIFDTAIKVLENNKIVGLFPEAAHSGKRQMLIHKKAVPRIAFLSESKNNFGLNLQVVPVGIYYEHYWHFNRSILINYGKPINVLDYKTLHEENEYKATLSLRQDIVSELKKLIFNIKSKDHYENYELLRDIWGEKFAKTNKTDENQTINRFYSDINLIKQLELQEKETPEIFKELHYELDNYRELLKHNKLEDKTIKKINGGSLLFIAKFISATLLLPILAVGSIVFAVPFGIPRAIIQKKVKDESFLSTFQFVAGLITHTLFLAFVAILLFAFTNNIILSFASIFILLLLGKVSSYILKLWKEILQEGRFRLMKFTNKHEFDNLIQSRKSCLKQSVSSVFS